VVSVRAGEVRIEMDDDVVVLTLTSTCFALFPLGSNICICEHDNASILNALTRTTHDGECQNERIKFLMRKWEDDGPTFR
jgi:hypothetical protein